MLSSGINKVLWFWSFTVTILSVCTSIQVQLSQAGPGLGGCSGEPPFLSVSTAVVEVEAEPEVLGVWEEPTQKETLLADGGPDTCNRSHLVLNHGRSLVLCSTNNNLTLIMSLTHKHTDLITKWSLTGIRRIESRLCVRVCVYRSFQPPQPSSGAG